MAGKIFRNGKALAGIIAVLTFCLAGVIIWCNAQAGTVSEVSVDPNEQMNSLLSRPTSTYELVHNRGPNRRVWEVVRDEQVIDQFTKQPTIERWTSHVVEMGSGICYADEHGNWQVTDASWQTTETGFVMNKARYTLATGPKAGSWLEYTIDGEIMYLRPRLLAGFDGSMADTLAIVDQTVTGSVDPNDSGKLVFLNAFGDGIELELVARPSGFHQNVIFRSMPHLHEKLDPQETRIHLFTELDLGEYASDGMMDIAVGELRFEAADFANTLSTEQDITFLKLLLQDDELHEYSLHRFGPSIVFDSSASETTAKKGLVKDSQGTYLLESLDYKFLQKAAYPVTWDYHNINGTWDPNDGIWYADRTYFVSDDLDVYDGTLKIEPGTFVKVAPGKKISTSGTGKIIARGKPYMHVFFTARDDDYNGQILNESDGTVSPGDYWGGLEIGDGSSVEFCSIIFSTASVKVTGAPASPLQHNHLMGRTAVEITPAALASEDTLWIFNNFMNGGLDYGVKCTGSAGKLIIQNNTFQNTGKAVSLSGFYASELVITDNIFSANNIAGIYADTGSFDPNGGLANNFNGYYNNASNTIGIVPGPNDITVYENPYFTETYSFHSWFLNSNPNGGAAFANAGSYLISDVTSGYADPNAWSIYHPEFDPAHFFDSPTIIDIDTQWHPNHNTCDTGIVALGYHHPRVDYMIYAADVTVDNATLAIMPGTVVVQRVNSSTGAGKLTIAGDARLVCIGEPFAGGYVNWIEWGRTGIYSRVGVPRSVTKTCISLEAGAEYDVQFSRFVGLGWAFTVNSCEGTMRDNIFWLNTRGIDYEFCTDFHACQNCLASSIIPCQRQLFFPFYDKGISGGAPHGGQVVDIMTPLTFSASPVRHGSWEH